MANATLERQIIGGLLHHPGVIAEKQITAEHFSDAFSVSAFGAMLAILGEGKQPDPVSTSERMGRMGDLGKLAHDWQETRPANRDTVSGWADSLKQLHRQLALLAALSDAQTAAQRGETPESVIASLLQKVGALEASGAVYARDIKQVLAGFIDTVEQRFQREGVLLGIPSGLTDLDELLLGFQPGNLYIVGARPGMGKSALMAEWAVHAGIKQYAVGIVSAEMSAEQLAGRMVASTGRIDHYNLNTGKLLDDQWPRMTSAVNILAETRIRITDKPACSVGEIGLQAREWALSGGLDILFVDYLSLLKSDTKHDTRTREVGDMAQGLKQLARALKIPVVCLAQLSRKCEERTNKRPINADLRDSGEIEQEADAILFLYRDEVYHENTKDKGIAEIIVSKNRHGPGQVTVKATWLGPYQRFENFLPYDPADHYGRGQGR